MKQELLQYVDGLTEVKEYPDFKIYVKKEQERLVKSDIIVMQFPFFWYSMPSIMHKYQ